LAVDIASPPPDASQSAPVGASGLDPAGWDPEPLKAHLVEPDGTLAGQYGLRV
jgi:hypothetical protein